MPVSRRDRSANPPPPQLAQPIMPLAWMPFERMKNPLRPMVAAPATSERSVVCSFIYIMLLSIWQ